MALVQEGNRSKPDHYYGNARTDLIDLLPRPLGRVLDVGCGSGGGYAELRAAGAERLTGIELMQEPAARAAEVYDRIEVGDAPAILERLNGSYDTILCFDVLEHLVDPPAVLRRLRALAAPGAHLQISVPNARYIALVFDLIVRGTFNYTDAPGHRDNTHLRWYTRSDMLDLIREAGWEVIDDRPAYKRFRVLRWLLDQLSRGAATEFASVQWYYLARLDPQSSSIRPTS